MVARRFFYVCAGLLCLAAAYALGAQTAGAQTGTRTIVSVCGGAQTSLAMTGEGDAFVSYDFGATWGFRGNVFGGPTSAEPSTLGQVKARWR